MANTLLWTSLKSRMERILGLFWKYLAIMIFGIFALLGFIVMIGEWYRQISTTPIPFSTLEEWNKHGLKISAWIDRSASGTDPSAVRVEILFDNQSPNLIHDLYFQSFETPGFIQVPGCWRARAPACDEAGNVVNFPITLNSQERSSRVHAFLRPQNPLNPFGIEANLSWIDAKSHKRHSSRVDLPEIAVQQNLFQTLFHDPLALAPAAARATEICALPFILALTGLAFQMWDKNRTEKQAKREEQDKVDRAWQVSLQETWRLQLPKFQENVSAFYLPCVSAVTKLLRRAEDISDKSPDHDVQQCLYNILRVIHSITIPSGILFRDRDGEEIVQACWDNFAAKLRKHLHTTERRFESINIDKLTLSQFRDIAGSSAKNNPATAIVKEMTQDLLQWLRQGSFSDDLQPLRILNYVLMFEINRTLEVWYGYLDGFDVKKFEEMINGLPLDCQDLRARLEAYQKNCVEYAENSRKRWERIKTASR